MASLASIDPKALLAMKLRQRLGSLDIGNPGVRDPMASSAPPMSVDLPTGGNGAVAGEGLIDRIRSTANRIRSGLFPVPEDMQSMIGSDETNAARKAGLLQLGATMLAGSGPTVGGKSPTFLQLLGQGLIGGREAASESAIGSYKAGALRTATQQAGEDRKVVTDQRERERQFREYVTKTYPMKEGMTAQESAERRASILQDAVAMGVIDAEKLGPVVANEAYLRRDAQPKATPVDIMYARPIMKDGKLVIPVYDKNDPTGKVLRYEDAPPPKPTGTGTGNDRAERRLDAQNLNAVLDDYRSDAGSTVKLLTRLKPTIAKSNYEKALNNDAGAQISLLYGFVNLMDETAVREGEQAMVRQAGPWLDQAKGVLQKYVAGESYSVGKTLLKQIYPIMVERSRSFSDQVETARERARTRANLLGVKGVDDLIKPIDMGLDPVPGAGPTANEASLSDADLWQAKVAAGMSKEAATAYVKARKR